jgi:cell division protein FtsI (penicillin-binding protein 3)
VHGYGWLSVAQALQHSSNVALAKLSERLDAATQYNYLRAFGFGSRTGVTYPSESAGMLQRPTQWSKYSAASLAIGYEISVTPLQLLLAYGALANGVVLMEPRLIRQVRERTGGIVEIEPRPVRRAIPERTAEQLRPVLADVVTEGTAKAAALGPFSIAGKTGTSRSYVDGHYRSGAYASTFAGFFPVENPQLVFLVKLDSPRGDYYGGLTAAPVTRATLEAAVAALNTPLDKRAVASNAPPPLAPVRFAISTPASKTDRGVLVGLKTRPSASSQSPSGPESPVATPLPDVMGLPLRDAVRQLHAAGFRVRVQGSGVVDSSHPVAGAMLPRGALIRLGAAEAGS